MVSLSARSTLQCCAIGASVTDDRSWVAGRWLCAAQRHVPIAPVIVLLTEKVIFKVGSFKGLDKARRFEQLEHPKALWKYQVEAIWQLSPVAKIVKVVDKCRIVKVAILSEVCAYAHGSAQQTVALVCARVPQRASVAQQAHAQ